MSTSVGEGTNEYTLYPIPSLFRFIHLVIIDVLGARLNAKYIITTVPAFLIQDFG